ncbi:unnamed protein product [Hydatigera taeniaeformis]|uniref:Uncharacterized protein n=1 Tax=Hydatigena taeniaeformis TaxID=6205 RepID=A0A0R3XDH7_HYDTA|nr:unnamed protein product [Hydatigera taeniaeformis]
MVFHGGGGGGGGGGGSRRARDADVAAMNRYACAPQAHGSALLLAVLATYHINLSPPAILAETMAPYSTTRPYIAISPNHGYGREAWRLYATHCCQTSRNSLLVEIAVKCDSAE